MIYLRMLLQGNGAATKVQIGKIFTCPKTFFTWAGIDFPLHDDNKQREDEEEKEEEEEEEKEKEEDKEEVNVTNKYS